MGMYTEQILTDFYKDFGAFTNRLNLYIATSQSVEESKQYLEKKIDILNSKLDFIVSKLQSIHNDLDRIKNEQR